MSRAALSPRDVKDSAHAFAPTNVKTAKKQQKLKEYGIVDHA